MRRVTQGWETWAFTGRPERAVLLAGLAIILALALVGVRAASAQTPGAMDPRRILVVYNAAWPDQDGDQVGDSEQVARHYAAVRGVPAANLLALSIAGTRRYFPGAAAAAWADFHDQLVTPVKAKLASLGATSIDTLLFCYGVPYYLTTPATTQASRAVDSLMQVPDDLGDRTGWAFSGYWRSNPYFEGAPGSAGQKGHFSHALYSYASKNLYLVSRVDGIHMEAALDRIDGARYAERYGDRGTGAITGHAYIDSRHGFKDDNFLLSNYPSFPGVTNAYENYSCKMHYGKFMPAKVNMKTFWEYSNSEVGESGAKWSDNTPALTGPAAFFYFGWYNYRQYINVWEWLPGSVACDLNSNSIQKFDDPNRTAPAFLSEAFDRGLTAGSGVISEPYLSGHARPEVLLYYLVEGYPFAEAASLSDPTLFWRGVRLGDPLYAPFAPGLQRVPDTSKPAPPRVRVTNRTGTGAEVDVRLTRRLADPELCRATLAWGTDPTLGSTVPPGQGYHGRHALVLTSLNAAQPGYYARAELEDPAGNKTVTPIFALMPRAVATVEARALVTPATVNRYAPMTLRFSLAAAGSLANLTAVKAELWFANQWIDVTVPVAWNLSEVATDPAGEAVLCAVHIGAGFPPGAYKVRVSAATATATSQHEAPFTVK